MPNKNRVPFWTKIFGLIGRWPSKWLKMTLNHLQNLLWKLETMSTTDFECNKCLLVLVWVVESGSEEDDFDDEEKTEALKKENDLDYFLKS